ncbi:MAG: PorP/SprF family type IX secretion system membrane protein [Bacteroidota bacterium]
MKKITGILASRSVSVGWCVMILNLCNLCFGQDIHFSQFSSSPSTLNPASTGIINGNFRAVCNYKDQWRSFNFPYKTISGSYDMPFYRDLITDGSLGAGISFISDKAGDLDFGTIQVNLSVSANKSLDKNNNLSLGLQGGFAQRSIASDGAKQHWSNQYDPASTEGYDPITPSGETNPMENFSYGDFATGILWNYTGNTLKAHAGIALFHLNKPKQSFFSTNEKLYSKLVIHGGSKIDMKNSNVSFLPRILILTQGPTHEINLGALIKYRLQEKSKYTGEIDEMAVYFGGWYRFSDAFILNAGLDFKNFALGISYDVNVSKLNVATASRGGFEFSLIYIQPFAASRNTASPLM